jgi:hypothetical protein
MEDGPFVNYVFLMDPVDEWESPPAPPVESMITLIRMGGGDILLHGDSDSFPRERKRVRLSSSVNLPSEDPVNNEVVGFRWLLDCCTSMKASV